MLALDMTASLLISVIGMVYPIVTNKMLNEYIPNKMYSTIVIAGTVVLALYVIRMLLRYFVQYYGHIIGVGMRIRIFAGKVDLLADLFLNLGVHLLDAGVHLIHFAVDFLMIPPA